MIRHAENADSEAIAAIYNYYVTDSIITFSIKPVDSFRIQRQIQDSQGIYPFMVYEHDGIVTGFAYLNAFRHHDAYAHVAESTLYVDRAYHGKGIGKKLYQSLFKEAPGYGISEIVAVLAHPNVVSERLHETLGFEYHGRLPRMGKKFGAYHDITLWQKTLEL